MHLQSAQGLRLLTSAIISWRTNYQPNPKDRTQLLQKGRIGERSLGSPNVRENEWRKQLTKEGEEVYKYSSFETSHLEEFSQKPT
jgi:hypothetical protein